MVNYKKLITSLLFTMESLVVFGQAKTYDLADLGADFFFAYDDKMQPSFYTDSLHYHFDGGTLRAHPIENQFSKITFENQKFQKDFSLLAARDNQYLILAGLGIVLEVNEKGFNRLDISRELRNNFRAAFFQYNNAIYCHGGYGYWRYHDYIIYFNTQNKEWKPFPIRSGYKPQGRAYHFGTLVGDDYIFFGGQNYDEGLLNSIEKLDFKTKSYSNIGTLSSKYTFSKTTPLPEMPWAENQKFYYNNSSKQIALLDFKTLQFRMSENSVPVFSAIDRFFPVLLANDSLYYVTEKKEGKRKLVALSKNEIESHLGPWTNLLSLWDKIKFSVFIVLAVVLLAGAVRVFFLMRKKSQLFVQSVLLQDHYLTHKGEILILSQEQVALLLHLIEHKSVPIKNLLSLDYFKEYAESYKKQIVQKSLADLKSTFEENGVIANKIELLFQSDKKDKRQKIVTLKGAITPYRGWLDFVVRQFYW